MVFEHPFGQYASNDLVSRELEAFSVEWSSGPRASFSPARHAHVRGGRGLAVRDQTFGSFSALWAQISVTGRTF